MHKVSHIRKNVVATLHVEMRYVLDFSYILFGLSIILYIYAGCFMLY